MKQRITISLNKNTIKMLDAVIGKNNIQNRSQAIESIVAEHFSSERKIKALILGGKDINIKSLDTTLKNLEEFGVEEIIVAGGKNNENIAQLISSKKRFYGNTLFIKEDKPIGTAGAVKIAETYLGKSFFVIFSDVNCVLDLKKMFEKHKTNNKIATMGIVIVDNKKEMLDAIKIRGDNIIEFEYLAKKPTQLQNAGVIIFDAEALDYFPSKGSMEKEVLPVLAKEGKLGHYIFDSKWEHSE